MAESWYTSDRGSMLFSGLENEQNTELATVFREMVIAADNGYLITANRYNVVNPITDVGVIVQSSTTSKHGEKLILFPKGELMIGDFVNYKDEKYLISNWVNEEISMNDSAPMHLCNANAYYDIETKTASGDEDLLGREEYDITVVRRDINMVFDTLKYYSDKDFVVNLEKDVVECWVQYDSDLMFAVNNEIVIYTKAYTIEGISRDLLSYNTTTQDYLGILKLRLKIKE